MNPADKTPRRRHLALIAVAAVFFILAVNSAATQFAADRLSYHPALGAPWAGKVYAPWAWIGWRAQFYDQARTTFDLVAAGFGAVGVMASLALMFTVGLQGRSARRHEGVHGTAHWASRAEIEATGLLPRRGRPGAGVYVGGWTDREGRLRYLRHDGPEHVAAIAPTRSGKGVGLVIPTLLSWPHSVVVNDMKAELWNSTAAWREKHGGAYGHDESIMSNCHVRAAYAPNKIETAEWLSRMAGTMTVVKEDITTTGNRFSAVLQNMSRTFHEVGRPLAAPDEIMRLKSPAKDDRDMIIEPGSMLIFVAGHPPIYGTQSLYFRDPVFSARVKLPVPAGAPGIAASRTGAASSRMPFKL